MIPKLPKRKVPPTGQAPSSGSHCCPYFLSLFFGQSRVGLQSDTRFRANYDRRQASLETAKVRLVLGDYRFRAAPSHPVLIPCSLAAEQSPYDRLFFASGACGLPSHQRCSRARGKAVREKPFS